VKNPGVAGAVGRPAALARELAECYKAAEACRTPSHGELHGLKAMHYHRARRLDYAQQERAEGRRRDSGWESDADDLAAERERQLAEVGAHRQPSGPVEGLMHLLEGFPGSEVVEGAGG
jgi:hypothetical protein